MAEIIEEYPVAAWVCFDGACGDRHRHSLGLFKTTAEAIAAMKDARRPALEGKKPWPYVDLEVEHWKAGATRPEQVQRFTCTY